MKVKLQRISIKEKEGYYVGYTVIESENVKNICLLKCCKYENDGYIIFEKKTSTLFKDAIESEFFLCDWDSDNNFISTEHKEVIENSKYYNSKEIKEVIQ